LLTFVEIHPYAMLTVFRDSVTQKLYIRGRWDTDGKQWALSSINISEISETLAS